MRTSITLLISMSSLLFMSCDKAGTSPSDALCGDGFNAMTGTVGDFGTGAAAAKVEAFLQATAALNTASIAVESDLLEACMAIATDLGIPAAELMPMGSALPVTAACARVADEIEEIIQMSLPAMASLTIVVTPAVCDVDIDIAASCAGECDVTITGEAEVMCMGELVGTCMGSCMGECTVDASAMCEGTCSATCTGTCMGTCNGQCMGTCSAMDSMGRCVGTCTGMCTGTCSAECMGRCSGSCTADVMASCMGECRGECSGMFMASCDGHANVMADAQCKAACEARANATATCTEPEISVEARAVTDAMARMRLEALVMTLRENYPKILAVTARIETTLVPSSRGFATALEGAVNAVGEAGAKAAACLTSAVAVAGQAAGRIDASVSVSVMVSASVSASGSAM